MDVVGVRLWEWHLFSSTLVIKLVFFFLNIKFLYSVEVWPYSHGILNFHGTISGINKMFKFWEVFREFWIIGIFTKCLSFVILGQNVAVSLSDCIRSKCSCQFVWPLGVNSRCTHLWSLILDELCHPANIRAWLKTL